MPMKPLATAVEVPAGTYWLGDPCYTVPDADWMPLLRSCGVFGASDDPADGTPGPVGTVRGHEVLAFGTAFGDGEYPDQYGHRYPVDAGLIGLVPVALNPDGAPGVRKITFDAPTVCRTEDDGATLTFGPVVIHTGDEEDEDDLAYCESCGTEIDGWADQCARCERETDEDERNADADWARSQR